MNKYEIFYVILIIIWIISISYLIITENWIGLIKNLLIFVFSFIGGSLCTLIFGGNKDE